MRKADGLNKKLDWKVGIEKDNDNQVLIKNNWICSLEEVVIEGHELNILEKIKKARSKDKKVVRVVEEMKKAKVKVLQENEWQIERDLMLKDRELRAEIIWLHYDIPVVGHRGRWKTTELITRNYWWPGIMRDIGRYVEGYDMCQKIKNRTEEIAGKLKLSEVPEKLWTHLMVDFITKLLLVVKKDTILVICDRLFKMIYFVAITEETLVERLVRLFRDNI